MQPKPARPERGAACAPNRVPAACLHRPSRRLGRHKCRSWKNSRSSADFSAAPMVFIARQHRIARLPRCGGGEQMRGFGDGACRVVKRDELDALHWLFCGRIARGHGHGEPGITRGPGDGGPGIAATENQQVRQVGLREARKKKASFLKKRSKKLFLTGPCLFQRLRPKVKKVFAPLFSKSGLLLPLKNPNPRNAAAGSCRSPGRPGPRGKTAGISCAHTNPWLPARPTSRHRR